MTAFLSFSIKIICSLLIFTSAYNSFTLANNSNCNPDKALKLLHRRHVYRPAFRGVAQDVYVSYPKDGETINTNIEIADFCVKDHDPVLFGAKPVFAYSVDDDIGRRLSKATIILRGLESRAINSTVEFYGLN